MINDKRTYGDKYGRKWKTFHEKGIEQTVNVRVKAESERPVLYDIRNSSIVPSEKNGDIISFDAKLAAGDGNIIAVYPDRITSADHRNLQ